MLRKESGRRILAAILTLTFLFFCSTASARPARGYYPYHLDVSEGLSSNIVYKVVKWQDGCVWLATRQGIDRYDGFSVKNYSLFKDDIRTQDDGQKMSVSTDGGKDLWAFTDSGRLYRYDADGDSFSFFLSLRSPGADISLNDLVQKEDRLYACTSDGLFCLDVKTGQLLHRGLAGHDIKTAAPYVDDRLVAGGAEGLFFLTDDLQYAEPVGPSRGIDVQCLWVDTEQSRILIGSDGRGAWKYEKGLISPVNDEMPRAIVRSIVPLDESSILIGYDGAGVYLCGRDGTRASRFATDVVPEGELSLPTSSVYSLLADEGNIWVTSYRGGVTLFRKDSDSFLVRDPNEKVVSANFVHGLSKGNDGSLWLAFNSAIGHYDPQTGRLHKYLENAGGFLALAMDDEGYIWCGGYNTGTYRLDSRSGKAVHQPSLTGGAG